MIKVNAIKRPTAQKLAVFPLGYMGHFYMFMLVDYLGRTHTMLVALYQFVTTASRPEV